MWKQINMDWRNHRHGKIFRICRKDGEMLGEGEAVLKMHRRMKVLRGVHQYQASFATSFNLFFVTIPQISHFFHTMVKYLLFHWKSMENRIYFDSAFLDHIYYIK